jgi:hypothetical protein
MAAVVREAMDDYKRKKVAEEFNAAVERTRADPEAWADYKSEVAIFDKAAGDGLGTDDIPEYDLPEDADL